MPGFGGKLGLFKKAATEVKQEVKAVKKNSSRYDQC